MDSFSGSQCDDNNEIYCMLGTVLALWKQQPYKIGDKSSQFTDKEAEVCKMKLPKFKHKTHLKGPDLNIT